MGERSELWEEPAKLLLCFLMQLTGVDFLRPLQMFQQPASGDEYMAIRSDFGWKGDQRRVSPHKILLLISRQSWGNLILPKAVRCQSIISCT